MADMGQFEHSSGDGQGRANRDAAAIQWTWSDTVEEWEDPSIQDINKCAPHTPLFSFTDTEAALQGALPFATLPLGAGALPASLEKWRSPSASSRTVCLNGEWDFRWTPIVTDAPASMVPDGGWTTIAVPASIQTQGFGLPVYTNQQYPFPLPPPQFPAGKMPQQNEVGDYHRQIELPEEALSGEYQVFIVFEGVESCASIFVDGVRVGLAKDSRVPAEFNITEQLLKTGGATHSIAVRTYRYSDGSLLEDQDHWRLSGIYRDVRLLLVPTAAAIRDFEVQATAAGHLSLSCDIVSFDVAGTGAQLRATLRPPGASTLARPAVATMEASVEIAAGGTAIVSTEAQLTADQLLLWSAESPTLYTLVLELSAGGDVIQCESCAVGFRTVKLCPEGRGMIVNGNPVIVKGVNRHEHDPLLGKTCSIESMLDDCLQLKQYNFNSVRTSHYPTHPAFLVMCDAIGLFVCDEANVETHGLWTHGRGAPANGGEVYHAAMPGDDRWRLENEPVWEAAYMDRMKAVVERDKNHSCVIMWSLGNESEYGEHHDCMADWTRARDPSRLIAYEPARRGRATDIICPMYASAAEIIKSARDEATAAAGGPLGPMSRGESDPNDPANGGPSRFVARHHALRPIILCEYCHAMGNSVGNLKDTWDVIRATPGLQGGFIWDYKDQGLVAVSGAAGASATVAGPGGTELTTQEVSGQVMAGAGGTSDGGVRFFGYGGAFGDAPTDLQFCVNGLVFPDRAPHPAMDECKKVFSPINITYDAASSTLAVTNLHDSVTLAQANLGFRWELATNGVVWASGDIAPLDAAPQEETQVVLSLPAPPAASVRAPECHLTISYHQLQVSTYAPAGFEVGWEQFAVPQIASEATAAPAQTADAVQMEETDDSIFVRSAAGGTEEFSVEISKTDGALLSFVFAGEEVLAAAEDVDDMIPASLQGPKREMCGPHGNLLPRFFRAALDNDMGGGPSSFAARWKSYGLHTLRVESETVQISMPPVEADILERVEAEAVAMEPAAGSASQSLPYVDVVVSFTMAGALTPGLHMGGVGQGMATVDMRYRVHACGTVNVGCDISISRQLPPLPRIGIGLAVGAGVGGSGATVEWFGRGPGESYPDRLLGNAVGRWQDSVEAQFVPYLFPTENGSKAATRWLALRGPRLGLLVATPKPANAASAGSETFHFGVQRFSTAQLDTAKEVHELSASEKVLHLSLDHAMMGVGGDDSWTPRTHDEYLVIPGKYSFEVQLRPFALSGEEDAEAIVASMPGARLIAAPTAAML